jgi:hypothetical protein
MVRKFFVMAREHSRASSLWTRLTIGSSRGSNSEIQRTVRELLNQLDEFESTKNIKVIMSTNQIGLHFLVYVSFPVALLFPHKIINPTARTRGACCCP